MPSESLWRAIPTRKWHWPASASPQPGSAPPKPLFIPRWGCIRGSWRGILPLRTCFRKIDQRELAPDTDFNDPGKIRNFESSFTARLNLYNGGQDRLGVQIARTGEKISRLDLHVVENSLIASVIETYYDTLAAKSLISIAEESVITVDTQLRVMNVRYRAGGALKSDILSLEVRLAEAREEAVIAQNRYLKTIAALANLMGIGPEPPLSLVENEREPLRLPEHYLGGVAMALAAFYNCVENHFEELESVWDDLYAPRYGFWRPYITDVIWGDENAHCLTAAIPPGFIPPSYRGAWFGCVGWVG